MIKRRYDKQLKKLRYFFGDNIEIFKNNSGFFYYKTLTKVEMPYCESFGYGKSVHNWDSLKGLDIYLSSDDVLHILEVTNYYDRYVEINGYNKDLTLARIHVEL